MKIGRIRVWVGLPWALRCLVTFIPAHAVQLVESGKARAVIVAPVDTSSRFVAEELQRYVAQLTGTRLAVISVAEARRQPAHLSWILVGGPEKNAIVRQAADLGELKLNGLKEDGFTLKTLSLDGRRVLVVAGNQDAATMYAAYDLVERFGVVFLLTGDILPPPKPNLDLNDLDVRKEPAFSRRGLNTWFGYPNMSVMSLADLRKFVDQMAKMKFNYLQVGWLPYEPWLEYGYKGEKKWMGDVTSKESGYLLWRRDYGSYKTSDLPVGKEQFRKAGAFPRLAAPEFQHVQNNEQAFAVARSYMRSIITFAKARKIKVWLQIDATSLPPNLARYTTRALDLPFNPLMATFICPNNPVSWKLNESRVKSLFDNYPGAEGYFLYLSEDYPVCDATPKDRTFYQGLRSNYPSEADNMTAFTRDIDRRRAIDSNSGSVFLIQKIMRFRDQTAPQIKLGVAGLGRLYMFPDLDKMLPKNVPFTDMDSSAQWTPEGVPMQLFAGMGDRERTLSNRIDDDSSILGMQFNVGLFQKDRVLSGAMEAGLSGFSSQVNRPRGTETNSKYMAEGEWNPNLTPEEFYRDYSRRIFGLRAAPVMLEAFKLLEKNEEEMGWTGSGNFNCCDPIPQLKIAYEYYRQPNPFDGPTSTAWKTYIEGLRGHPDGYSRSISILKKALQKLEEAATTATPGSRHYLDYLINRTECYILHLQTLASWDNAYLDLDRVFQQRQSVDEAVFAGQLDKTLDEFKQTHDQAVHMALQWAEGVDHPSDLGVLYRIDMFMVTGTELTVALMQNIDNFHHGRDYVQPVPFDKIFVGWPVLQRDEQRQF